VRRSLGHELAGLEEANDVTPKDRDLALVESASPSLSLPLHLRGDGGDFPVESPLSAKTERGRG